MHIRKEAYQDKLKVKKDFKKLSKNASLAFIFGGTTCLIGQLIILFYEKVCKFENDVASMYMIATVIIISAILSAFGIYDKIGQIGKCGMAIPITGFSNAMVSSAMEYKPEGFILGIGANTFKLAGSVIILGVTTAGIVSLIRYVVGILL